MDSPYIPPPESFYDLNIWLIAACWGLAMGLGAWYIARSLTTVTYVTLADGRRTERRLPLAYRFLLPWTANLKFLQGETYAKSRKKVQAKLVASGYDGLLTPSEFLSLRFLMPLIVGPFLILILYLALQRLPIHPQFPNEMTLGDKLRARQLLIYPIILVLCYLHPNVWLKKMVAKRKKEIERALPFVLDLLTLSVEAGLDFMSGLRRIVDRRKMDPLGEELVRVFREMQVGRTRREALRDMADRTDHGDVKSVVNALVQADELGVSIGYVLRIQADQMRQRRFQRAEEMANKAPVKMLFPLTCFIFPAVFIILLGPVLLDVSKRGFF